MKGLMLLMGALLLAGCGGPLSDDAAGVDETRSSEGALSRPQDPTPTPGPTRDPCTEQCKDVTDPLDHSNCYKKCRVDLER